MNHNEKLRLARYIAESRRTHGVASVIAASKLDSIVVTLAHQLPDGFTYDQMEEKLRAEIHAFPSVKAPAAGSAEEADIAARARAKAGPSRKDWAKMDALSRLEAINLKNQAERDAAAAEAAKTKTEFTHDQMQAMSPSQKLAFHEMMSHADEPKPKTYSPEEIRKMNAMQRLDVMNEKQIEAARAAKKDKKS
jgi:hypothetical protein